MIPTATGYRLVIKPDELEEYSEGGIAIVHSKFEKGAVQIGTILSIGERAWKAFDKDAHGIPCGKPWAKVGDRVVFSKYAARFFKADNDSEEIAFLNDEDVLAVIGE